MQATLTFLKTFCKYGRKILQKQTPTNLIEFWCEELQGTKLNTAARVALPCYTSTFDLF